MILTYFLLQTFLLFNADFLTFNTDILLYTYFSPLYNVLDHTNLIFSERLSSDDDYNDQDKYIQKTNINTETKTQTKTKTKTETKNVL